MIYVHRHLTLLSLLCYLMTSMAKPTVYMINENDKLEPFLVPVSSTVIPIPVYQVSSHINVRKSKSDLAKNKLKKPDGPAQLITVSGLKKMMANEHIKPH